MAAKKKGPAQLVGLKCEKCDSINYTALANKTKLQVKGQTLKDFTFTKYCNTCRTHNQHVTHVKLK